MMSLDEKKALISYRKQKAYDSLREAKAVAQLGFWNLAGNRLYYAVFHMASALLLDKGFVAKTHSGVIHLIGANFVTTNRLSKEEGRLFSRLYELRQSGDYDDICDAGIIVITAGANQKPDETRLDLVHKNVEIFKSIIPEIAKRDYKGILLIVSNPVDILTYAAVKLSGLPENRVIGSGTVLDTARLKYLLGEHLAVDSRSVHAFIIGEHGDSEIAVWSSANVSGIPIDDFCEMRGHYDHVKAMREIAENVKNSAYEIIARKQATYYGIAMSVKRICEVIVRDEKSILPISTMIHGEYGIDDIALSMPAIVGSEGVETHVPISLNKQETESLIRSAETLRGVADGLGL